MTLRCDIAVVGAGPAGAMTALTAARAGLDVILLDSRKEIGLPLQCAEYVPRQLVAQVPWPAECVAQPIPAMHTHLPDGETVTTTAAGYTIHRPLFDRHLAQEAQRAGARLFLNTRALERTAKGFLIRHQGRKTEIEAAVIVGADGPTSTVGRWIGQTNRWLLRGHQCTVTLRKAEATTHVYFHPEYEGGYGWFFPKGETANVGVGIRKGLPPGKALAGLLERLSIREEDVIGYSGGWIPCGGPTARTVEDNIILVGDAAGHTHPVTGAGVAHACLCGQIAAETAVQAVKRRSPSALEGYEAEWRDFLGGVLSHAAARRRRMMENWVHDPKKLADLLRETWIAFPAYGRRSKEH